MSQAPTVIVGPVKWTEFPPHTYRVLAWMIPAEEGGFTVESINLPGCITEGKTWDECIAMLKEAATGLILTYRQRGEKIPWVKSGPMPERPEGAKRITVYVTVPPEPKRN